MKVTSSSLSATKYVF